MREAGPRLRWARTMGSIRIPVCAALPEGRSARCDPPHSAPLGSDSPHSVLSPLETSFRRFAANSFAIGMEIQAPRNRAGVSRA